MKKTLYNDDYWAIIWTICILLLVGVMIYEICDPRKQVSPIGILYYILLIISIGKKLVVYIAERCKNKK